MSPPGRPIRAAGGLLWRDGRRGPELCLVHRPTHRDWTLPKGKLEPGEGWTEAALREVLEESGSRGALERFAGVACYWVGRRPKVVLYWVMRALGEGRFEPNEEIDAVLWLPRSAALEKLTHAGERSLVERDGWLERDGAGAVARDAAGVDEVARELAEERRELEAEAARPGAATWETCALDLVRLGEAALARGRIAEARAELGTARRVRLLGVDDASAPALAAQLREAAGGLPTVERRRIEDVLAAGPWPEALLFAAAVRDGASSGHPR